jgi:hypothetical protein
MASDYGEFYPPELKSNPRFKPKRLGSGYRLDLSRTFAGTEYIDGFRNLISTNTFRVYTLTDEWYVPPRALLRTPKFAEYQAVTRPDKVVLRGVAETVAHIRRNDTPRLMAALILRQPQTKDLTQDDWEDIPHLGTKPYKALYLDLINIAAGCGEIRLVPLDKDEL